jgi:methionyl-tRNA synthetase
LAAGVNYAASFVVIMLLPFLPATAAKIIDMLHEGIVKEAAVTDSLFPKIYKYTEAPKKRG